MAMNVKCPHDDCGRSFDNEREFLKHLLSYVTEKEKLSYIRNYVKLLFKIHGKIKEWEREPYPVLEVSIESVIDELKSLVDSEK